MSRGEEDRTADGGGEGVGEGEEPGEGDLRFCDQLLCMMRHGDDDETLLSLQSYIIARSIPLRYILYVVPLVVSWPL